MEIESKLEEISIDRVCRTCLSTGEESMISLYDEDDVLNLNYFQIISITFGKIVPPIQNLPTRICSECQDIVKRAYEFKKECQKSNSIITINETIDFIFDDENDKCTQTDVSQFMQFDENFDSINLQTSDDVIFEASNDRMKNPLSVLNNTIVTQPLNDSKTDEIEVLDNNEEQDEEIIEQQQQHQFNEIEENVIIDSLNQVQELTEYQENPFCNGNENEFEEELDENSLKSPKNRQHQCEKCNKTFARATHLKRHLLTHEDIKPINCSICSKGFSRADHLNHHMLSNHSESKPYHCDVPDCKKGFVKEEHLRKHVETKHRDTPKEKEICSHCQKTFSSKKYLRSHMRVHNNSEKNCVVKKDSQNDKKPYLCSECGLRFVRNDYLVIHMRRHLGVKPYKCKFCDKGFPRATDLTVHERYHTNEKTHLCNLCGKGFQRAYNLLVHMRVHTGERPYQCTYCSKSFSQGNDLKAHIRRHTGERFKCDLCNEGFIQGYHLTHHKRTVHGLDVKSHIRRVEKFVNTTSSASSSLSVPIDQVEKQELLETLEDEHIKIENEYQFSAS